MIEGFEAERPTNWPLVNVLAQQNTSENPEQSAVRNASLLRLVIIRLGCAIRPLPKESAMRSRIVTIGALCLFLGAGSCAQKKPPATPTPGPAAPARVAQPAGIPAEPQEEERHVFGTREGSTCGVHCGTERWRVKTLAGTGAADVNFSPQTATVRKLMKESAPQSLSDTRRETAVEQQTVQVKALVIGYKREPDGDLHIVIADLSDPEITMIVEIPDAEKCSFACSSAHAEEFRVARKAFLDGIKDHKATKCFRTMQEDDVEITMTGVPMFDRLHGQTGVAENGLELHPLLSVEWSGQGLHAAACATN
jgi:hypothetical protein